MSQDEFNKKINNRYIIISIIVALCGFFIIARLVDLQIVHGQEYFEESQTRIMTHGEIYARRGSLFDRNGIPIAESRLGFFLQYVDTKITDAEKNRMFLELSKILDKNGESYTKSLSRYIKLSPVRFVTRNPEDFIKGIVVRTKDAESLYTAQDVFQYMREKTFEIDPEYSDEEAYKIMMLRYEILCKRPNITNPMELAADVSPLTVAEIEERSSEFYGVTTYSKPIRYYIEPELVSHVLGYVRGIGDGDLAAWSKEYPEKKYNIGDIVGQIGIERAAEKYLRGVNGKTTKEVDYQGRLMAYWEDEPAIPGNDVYLTIDLNLQRAAMESLEKNIKLIRDSDMGKDKNFHDANAGAVVALDVNTGEVLAMASYPSYNPDSFLENNDSEIMRLMNDPERAMYNRATRGLYAPGSTYKPLIAIAALEENIVTPETKIFCPASETIEGWHFTNLEGYQGYINLERAVATSSNMYFFKLGIMTQIDNITKWAHNFGFGTKTGIEIAEEEGDISSKEYKKRIFNEVWVPANTAMSAIGQLYNRYTPLQLTNYVSTIANGGRRYTPHLIKKVVSADRSIIQDTKTQYVDLPVDDENMKAVQKGMVSVANAEDGTAVSIFRDWDFPFKVAGKTGTAETSNEGEESSNALFVCYAPADDPQIAVAVVIEHGVWGAYTAPIAKDVLTEYFRLHGEDVLDDNIENTEFEIDW